MQKGAICARGVCLEYHLSRRENRSLKSLAINLLRRRRSKEVLRALRDVSIDIEPGETFGIVGANGSGKSTLLKVMAGILRPSAGEMRLSGRVTSLLELAAGFHPALTGGENIFINGLILGLSRTQIKQRLDRIVEFSGLAHFIDCPVRHYSAGMLMRLGFSIAVNADPDIFLIDEVLGVGDAAFQRRCFPRIQELQKEGKTIVFVSHSLETLEALCSRGIWLDHGRVAALASMREVIEEYRESVSAEDHAIVV